MKEHNPRRLLARLRSGNYAHPGDTEAIDIFMDHLERHQHATPMHILDVGCGRGGTANYIKEKNSQVMSVTGIDIDEQAIAEAKSLYNHIDFNVCDIKDIDQISTQKFDLIYMFSVFYAFPEPLQKEFLNKLAGIAQDGAILAICDYIRLEEDRVSFNDFSGKPMKPPLLDDLKLWLTQSGWELIEEVDLNTKYQQWYRAFLEKLSNSKDDLLLEFTEDAITQVSTVFQLILKKIDTSRWGGIILYARLNKK